MFARTPWQIAKDPEMVFQFNLYCYNEMVAEDNEATEKAQTQASSKSGMATKSEDDFSKWADRARDKSKK